MNLFAYQSLASLGINVVLAAYILSKNPRGSTARIYVLLLITFILWNVPEFIVRAFPPEGGDQLLLLIRVQWTGIAFIPGVMAHFVLAYPRRTSLLDQPWSLLLIYTPSVVFTSFLWAGDLLVKDVGVGLMGHTAVVGSLYLPLASLYAIIIIVALAYLSRAYWRPQDRRSKIRSLLLLAGFAIPTLAGTVTEVFWPVLSGTATRMGLGSAYTTVFLAFVAYAVFRYGFLVIEPVTEVGTIGTRFGWQKGRNYLVLERGRDNSFAVFREMLAEAPGLCVTAFPPQVLAEEFALHKTPILWLSSQEGYTWSLRPTYLEVDVLQTVLKFMRDNPGSALMMDDLEYLVEVNGFKPVLRTVATMASSASKNRCTLVVNLNPACLNPSRLALLKGVFDEVSLGEAGRRPRPHFLSSPSILWEGKREDCFREISRATIQRKALISTLFPGKLQADYDLYDAVFLWISTSSDPSFPSYDSSRLTLEVLRDVSRTITEDTLVYLGELELLVEEGGFLNVLEFIKHVVDLAVMRSGLVVASVNTRAMPENQLFILEKRFADVMT